MLFILRLRSTRLYFPEPKQKQPSRQRGQYASSFIQFGWFSLELSRNPNPCGTPDRESHANSDSDSSTQGSDSDSESEQVSEQELARRRMVAFMRTMYHTSAVQDKDQPEDKVEKILTTFSMWYDEECYSGAAK